MWLATQAVKTESKVIPVSHGTLGVFMQSLGVSFSSGGAWAPPQRIRQQLKLLMACEFVTDGQRLRTQRRGAACSHAILGVHHDGNDDKGLSGHIELSDWFFQECKDRQLLLNREAVRMLRGSTVALDVYVWLRQLQESGARTGSVGWHELARQLGRSYATASKMREVLGSALDRVAMAGVGLTLSTQRERVTFRLGRL